MGHERVYGEVILHEATLVLTNHGWKSSTSDGEMIARFLDSIASPLDGMEIVSGGHTSILRAARMFGAPYRFPDAGHSELEGMVT